MRSTTTSLEAVKQEDIKEKKPIIFQPSLERDLDDSSDEEDNAIEEDYNLLIDHLTKNNPDILHSHSAYAGLMELASRKIIYHPKVRNKYLEKKETLNRATQREMLTDKYGDREIDSITEIIKTSFQEALRAANPSSREYPINFDSYRTNRQALLRKTFKQAHRENIMPFFAALGQAAIQEITARAPSLIQIYRQELNDKAVVDSTLTAEKIFNSPELKKFANQMVKNSADIAKETNNYEESIRSILQFDPANFSQGIKSYLKKENPSLNGNALNTATKKCLEKWISDSFDNGDLNSPKPAYNTSPIKIIIEKAREQNFTSITNCTKTRVEFTDEYVTNIILNDLYRKFTLNFCTKLQQRLKAANLFPEDRTRITRLSTDAEEIKDPVDLFAKEHLIYRSATRQSREFSQTTAACLAFDPTNEIIVEKKQDIGEARSTINEESNNIAYRGTLQEEVYNLGNYDSVYDILRKFAHSNIAKIPNGQNIDAYYAILIRNCFKRGISILEEEEYKNLRNTFSKSEFREFKQRTAEMIELLFGTEVWRSPASLIETNMMLDLIIAGHKNFNQSFSNISNGGELSHTMKAKDNKPGGIALGRELSSQTNEQLVRQHKYGGPKADKQSLEFKEYIDRKANVAKSWLQHIAQLENGLQPSHATILSKIEEKQAEWFGQSFTL